MYALLQWSSFLETFKNSRRVDDASMYALFPVEPLYNPHLGILKMLRQYTVTQLTWDRLVAGVSVK